MSQRAITRNASSGVMYLAATMLFITSAGAAGPGPVPTVAPTPPQLVAPADGDTIDSLPAVCTVIVDDPDGDLLDVRFHEVTGQSGVAVVDTETEWQAGAFDATRTDGAGTLILQSPFGQGTADYTVRSGMTAILVDDAEYHGLTVEAGGVLVTLNHVVRVCGLFANYGTVRAGSGGAGALGGVGGVGADPLENRPAGDGTDGGAGVGGGGNGGGGGGGGGNGGNGGTVTICYGLLYRYGVIQAGGGAGGAGASGGAGHDNQFGVDLAVLWSPGDGGEFDADGGDGGAAAYLQYAMSEDGDDGHDGAAGLPGGVTVVQIPLPLTGTYTSTIFDAGMSARWSDPVVIATTPPGSAVSCEYSTGNGVWSADLWDLPVSPTLQVRLNLLASDVNQLPSVDRFASSYLGVEPFGAVPNVPPGQPASCIWPGLVEGWTYHWRVEVDDGTAVTVGPTWQFRTSVACMTGPEFSARDVDLAQDGFPERGMIDVDQAAYNWIRFDMCRNIAPPGRIDPGDSLVVDLRVRPGAALWDMPRMFIMMKTNPAFDGVRVIPPGNFAQIGGFIHGWVYGDSTFTGEGQLVPDQYHFVLPDTGFFYPGDLIRYFFEARDVVGGDVRTATLPADTSGLASFAGLHGALDYSEAFTVRGLPSLDAAYHQPEILCWTDYVCPGTAPHWIYALENLGYHYQVHYDVYATGAPSSGLDNGLGGRATPATIGGYRILLYGSGDHPLDTLESDEDISLLTAWFQLDARCAFLTGDFLVSSLSDGSEESQLFRDQLLGVEDFVPVVIPPGYHVQAIPANSVFRPGLEWNILTPAYDAIDAVGTTERLAEIANYPYAGATRHGNSSFGSDVIVLPYDFSFAGPVGYSRAVILEDVLEAFAAQPPADPTTVPPGSKLSICCQPNPCNPRTTITLTLPCDSHLDVRIYDLRGSLIRTVLAADRPAGVVTVVWDGTGDRGESLPSGVYFVRATAGRLATITKVTLVK